MNGRTALGGLVLCTALATAAEASGQVVLDFGGWVEGVLEASDSRDGRGRIRDLYRFPPGFLGVFRLTVESEEFDTTVRVEAPLGEVVEILGESDDFPGLASGTDSRSYGRVRPGGIPEIQVRSWSGEAAGRYRIRLDSVPRVAPWADTVAYGADVRGALAETDAFVNGAFEDRFRFRGAQGEVVRVLLESDEFDAFLELWDEESRFIAQDDDGFEVDDAWIEVELPASRTYEIRVRPSPAGRLSQRVGLGEYRLRLGPGLQVEPDPTLGGLAFTHAERTGLLVRGGEVRHDALGFRFPAPPRGFTLMNVSLGDPEALDPVSQVWQFLFPKSGEELVVMAAKLPEAPDAVRLHRVAKMWVDLTGGTFLEERMDWEGSRSVWVRMAHPGQAWEVRCTTSDPERAPPILVCLCDGGSFREAMAGLQVR
ncbi:MAG TPA: hypothetical protein VLA43_16420 [Longimicrobiales bacterium]|nr:hypothetical protein [Longimicrobiales bacterium]